MQPLTIVKETTWAPGVRRGVPLVSPRRLAEEHQTGRLPSGELYTPGAGQSVSTHPRENMPDMNKVAGALWADLAVIQGQMAGLSAAMAVKDIGAMTGHVVTEIDLSQVPSRREVGKWMDWAQEQGDWIVVTNYETAAEANRTEVVVRVEDSSWAHGRNPNSRLVFTVDDPAEKITIENLLHTRVGE